ncbi:MAG TPA: S4 domain-containing protein, partial [Phycisphaerae bacterium]|nr:S4 domain-containing protein [Phycisphaerae bacterium]
MTTYEDEILDRPIPVDDDEAQRVRLRIRRKLPGRRLDKYLHGRFPHLSRTTIQRLIKQGAVTVNNQPTKPSYEMAGGDIVELVIPPPEPREVVPENIPLDVVYEDDFILALNKPAGIICHPARGDQTGTIANALVYYANELSHGADP